MAVIWISTSGDWSSNASWSTGAAPVSTDDVFLINNGAVAVSSGLSQGAVDLASLNVIDFPFDIGTSAAPLVIGSTAFRFTGSGASYIQNDSAGAETVWVASSNRTAALKMTGTTVSRMVVLRGVVEVGCAVTRLQVGHVDNPTRDAVVTVNGVTVSELYQSAGYVTTTGGATVSAVYKAEGTFDFQGSAGGSLNLIQGGGLTKYQATNTRAPNIGVLELGNGTVDLSSPYSTYAVTYAYILGRADFKKHPMVTVTTEYNVNKEVADGPQV